MFIQKYEKFQDIVDIFPFFDFNCTFLIEIHNNTENSSLQTLFTKIVSIVSSPATPSSFIYVILIYFQKKIK